MIVYVVPGICRNIFGAIKIHFSVENTKVKHHWPKFISIAVGSLGMVDCGFDRLHTVAYGWLWRVQRSNVYSV